MAWHDHRNLEGYDPDQESEMYEYCSDPRLELEDAFKLAAPLDNNEQ